ncbi:hypothetical protein Hanom_Chr07g00645741 [Helianthus anomalus]
MASTSKHFLVLTFFLLAFLFIAFVPCYAPDPACLGECDAIKEDCLTLCQSLRFATGSCVGNPSRCCCHN